MKEKRRDVEAMKRSVNENDLCPSFKCEKLDWMMMNEMDILVQWRTCVNEKKRMIDEKNIDGIFIEWISFYIEWRNDRTMFVRIVFSVKFREKERR